MKHATHAAVVTILTLASAPACAQHGGMGHGGAMGPPPPVAIHVPDDGATVPMSDFGGRPIVQVTINGKGPYPFIFDTGASITVIDVGLDKELSLPEVEGMQAAGGHGQARIVTVRRLETGVAAVQGLTAAVMPLAKLIGAGAPRGVLSVNQFPGHLVTFDFPRRTITIAKGALPAEDDGGTFEYDGVIPTVTLDVAGHAARAHLDTGSGGGISLPTRYLTELPLASQPVAGKKAKLIGAEFDVTTARVKGDVVLGRYTLDAGEISFSDLRPGSGGPTANVGSAVLRRFVVTVDSRNRRVRVAG